MSGCPFHIFRPYQGLTDPFQFLFTLCFLSHRITFPYHYSLPKSMILSVMFFHVSIFISIPGGEVPDIQANLLRQLVQCFPLNES